MADERHVYTLSKDRVDERQVRHYQRISALITSRQLEMNYLRHGWRVIAIDGLPADHLTTPG